MAKDSILVGRFGAPHGVKGEIRLQSFTADPGRIATYGPLLDNASERSFVVEALRPIKADLFVAKIRGVTTRTAAEALTGLALFVPRTALPPPEPDEFYLADLIGLEAVTEDGVLLGRIIAVSDYGGGPLLEIAPGGNGETLLLPFTRAIIPVIDLVAARVIVVPPTEVSGEDTQPENRR
jgi:16S rRNA processing protein RimM